MVGSDAKQISEPALCVTVEHHLLRHSHRYRNLRRPLYRQPLPMKQ
jgi:hypothetical protein